MRNLSWARMVAWSRHWWPDCLWCGTRVAHFLNKVGKKVELLIVWLPRSHATVLT